jgi:hypothetical protein
VIWLVGVKRIAIGFVIVIVPEAFDRSEIEEAARPMYYVLDARSLRLRVRVLYETRSGVARP